MLRRWPTAPCEHPVSMAIDTAHHRLFSGCRSGALAVSDLIAGKVITTLPIGQGVDGAGFDPTAGDVFASNLDGTLTVIHQDTPDRYHVVGAVQTAQGSRNMGLDPTTHRIYVASARFMAPAEPTPANPRPRATVQPGSFALLVIAKGSGKSP